MKISLKKKALASLVFTAIFAVTTFAQAPAKFNYQAIARNNSGTLLDGQNLGIRVNLRTGTPTGTVIYSETHLAGTNQFGLFSLVIGDGSVILGDLTNVDWGSDSFFVEIEMDETGGSNYQPMGVAQLLSVPYALYAANAGGSGTVGPTGLTGATGVTGIAGADGAIGSTGATGVAGADGATGPTGADGLVGPTGVAGADGAQGVAGADGATGATGQQGAAGTGLANQGAWLSGTTYNPGDYVFAPSADNPNVNSMWIVQASSSFLSSFPPSSDSNNWVEFEAPSGPMGATGVTGATGNTGSIGLTGATGSQGIAGVAGATGSIGTTGAVGATGVTGIAGATGATGSIGVTGPTGAGLTGATGATGTAGGIGATGATGNPGLNGSAGATGATGATGNAGTVGAVGATGGVGATGATGATGDLGPTGPAGEAGPAGADGSASAWGLTGNFNTDASTNYIGTSDGNNLVFKVNGDQSGLIDFGNSSALTFLGFRAGVSNNGGTNNTAFGFYALTSTVGGSFNTAVGKDALYNNTSGSNNTATGFGAMRNNLTGQYNTAFGKEALKQNTQSFYNTAIGNQALYFNTGKFNTALGSQAAYNNKTGYSNVAIGIHALFTDTTASNIVAVGDSALYNQASGSGNNTAVGSKALLSNTTGSNNTALGSGANVSSGTLTNATAIGAGATVSLSNSLVLGNNVNVGIGSSSPGTKLDVVGKTRTTTFQLTTSPTNGYVLQTDGSGNGTWVNANTLTITETDPQVGSITTNYTPKWNGTSLVDGVIYDNGINVGIGTTTLGAKLEVNGQVKITGGSPGTGKVLTSDGSGLASWQSPQYAYIYNTGAQAVAVEANVNFSTNGVLTSGITHTAGAAGITIVNAGDYKISFNVSGTEASQFALYVNAVMVSGGVYGSAAGTQQNAGQAIVTVAANDVITLKNHTSAGAVNLPATAGGTQNAVNASIVIEKLN